MDAAGTDPSGFTIAREVNGETLVLDSHAELIHQLNRTATFIWQKARGGSSAGEIAAALAGDFDVELETADRDVAATLARLNELNLLERP